MKVIPYGHQSIAEDDIKEVVRVLRSDRITQGPKIKEFEEILCKYSGAKYAVVVSSGTAALHIASLASGIKSGDEVITSPITFIASANCVLYCGGKPVFVDVLEDTGNIDPACIKAKIKRKTKAVIPVHFAGHPCKLGDIYDIAKANNLIIIEDAAHALGGKYKGSKIGSCKYSDMTIFSFHPVKSITTGEGGAVLTNNEKYYEKLIMLREHGIARDATKFKFKSDGDWYYTMRCLGYNYRLTDIQCALGVSQFKKLDKFIQRRREIAGIYHKAFKNNGFFELPVEREDVRSSWHLYPIRLNDECLAKKKPIFSKLRKEGLGVQVHYIPVYRQSYYQGLGYEKGLCPNAEDFYLREISLPLYPSMSREEIDFVVDTIFKVFKRELE